MNNVYLQAFKAHGSSEDGYLSAIEKNTGLPFDIKRVYTVINTKEGNVRGYHAHRELFQIFFVLKGKIEVCCEDLEGNKEKYMLDDPHIGLVCGPYIWHTLTYHDNAILMVLASEGYCEPDYIRNYEDFLKERGK
ncbi:MAG: FdtA/QdtA family cupin domain-containing protein [Bacilli bacterium]|uniref:sugar 3,4-ketoisomerase n=1 Tax=Anaerorhabdus sp. TaxID=1872524 RepID=UPI002FC6204B